ncbi:hypothetical protein KM043_007394 [Ampulex compressa]|nr:hypothetical protein KM043_007394 [Ampulex compressa]
MAGKQQFDEFLGGSQALPHEVPILKLVSSRASEIAAMTYSIENPQQTKLVFQKLPVHMRRRVMSHNAKRLPRRLRAAYLNQMAKSGLPPKSKRPSRKYRRRPHNLLLEYNRRKGNKHWLETHIWHAKRFHMVEEWGYRIAAWSNDKCFKANYRAVAKHCLMQDISYYTCIELRGPETILKETLGKHCNPYELTFGAKIYTNGNREGRLYLVLLLNRKLINIPEINDTSIAVMSSIDQMSDVSEPLNNINDRICKDIKSVQTITDKTDQLEICNISGLEANSDEVACREKNKWYMEYYNIRNNIESFKTQTELWQVLKTLWSPSQLPPNIVFGATVLDPRFYLPDKRQKPHKIVRPSELLPMPPTNVNSSPLWDPDIRKQVAQSCMTPTMINNIRSDCLVPGIENDKYFKEDIMAKVPILLIQKPGNMNTGFGSGIDVIIPAGWSMPFWLAFLFRCVRVGALRESRSIAFEYLNTHSPDINDPDTPAYMREAKKLKLELTEKYFRYPPNRRVNFVKLAISSPFFCNWKQLMRDWENTEEFYVLRNRNLTSTLTSRIAAIVLKKHKSKKLNPQDTIVDLNNLFENKNCLVHVKISVLRKGCPKRFAIICVPTAEDLQKFDDNNDWSGPVERLHRDPNETCRKNLRKNHSILLKRLKRQRIRQRAVMEKNLCKIVSGNLDDSYIYKKPSAASNQNQELIRKHSEKMSSLYLPECEKVRDSCEREVMGFVTMGDFSLSEAKGTEIRKQGNTGQQDWK